MFESSIEPKILRSLGGSLCLAFANTLVYRSDEIRRADKLKDYASLLNWESQIGLLSKSQSQKLKQRARKWPGEASTVYQRSLSLRETIVRIFSGVAGGKDPSPDDLSAVNAMLSETLPRLRISAGEAGKKGLAWSWSGWGESLDSLLWPVVDSVGNLLGGPTLLHVKECEGVGCGWFFVDTSRNQLRRWCSMSDCGNRNKVRRFHARKKARKGKQRKLRS
jgi:predicted RNA-binding Zn ribbon-like protein